MGSGAVRVWPTTSPCSPIPSSTMTVSPSAHAQSSSGFCRSRPTGPFVPNRSPRSHPPRVAKPSVPRCANSLLSAIWSARRFRTSAGGGSRSKPSTKFRRSTPLPVRGPEIESRYSGSRPTGPSYKGRITKDGNEQLPHPPNAAATRRGGDVRVVVGRIRSSDRRRSTRPVRGTHRGLRRGGVDGDIRPRQTCSEARHPHDDRRPRYSGPGSLREIDAPRCQSDLVRAGVDSCLVGTTGSAAPPLPSRTVQRLRRDGIRPERRRSGSTLRVSSGRRRLTLVRL